MTKHQRILPWLGCSLCGVLMVLAFAPVYWSWLGWVCLVPAWLALRTSAAIQRQPMRYGYGVGLIFVAGCFWWIGATVPVGLAVMLAVLSIYPALWFLLVARLLPVSFPGRPLPALTLMGTAVAAAAFWVTLEWVRSWFLSGFNWNELGVSQTPQLYMRQLAALGGVPLLSFVLVLFNIFLAEATLSLTLPGKNRFGRSWLPALCGGVVLTASWLYGWCHWQHFHDESPTKVVSYACVQPNIAEIPYATAAMSVIAPREVDDFQLEERLSLEATRDRPDLLVWPEAITTQRLTLDPLIGRTVREILGNFHGDFLLGAEEMDQGRFYNCAYLLDPRSASLQKYRKIHLVIFGEYLPGDEVFPWLRKLWSNAISFTPGTEPVCFTLNPSRASFAPFICYEDTQPETVDDAVRLHPDFFITLTNDSWYAGFPAEWTLSEHLQNAVLRCVEHDRSMIRCANNGISCEISPDGTVLAEVQDDQGEKTNLQGILSRTLVHRSSQGTLYESWGDWIGLLSRLLTIVAGIAYLRKSISKSS